jgi:hypothetical protein
VSGTRCILRLHHPCFDRKLTNTFSGAAHLPPGAIEVLLVTLIVLNPLLKLKSEHNGFSRNEILTIYISCLIRSRSLKKSFKLGLQTVI